jgi:hypothetical protein
MSSYIDDLENFGDSPELTEACKQYFNRSEKILNESPNGFTFKSLMETAENDQEKTIAQDFKNYIKQIVKK